MAKHKDPNLCLDPLEIIFSCSVCTVTFSELYGATEKPEMTHNHSAIKSFSTSLWIADCTHVLCSKHFDIGGVPIFKDGECPQVACPVCFRTGDGSEKSLYAIRGFRWDEYDYRLPRDLFTFPPPQLDDRDAGLRIVKLHYLNLINFGIAKHKRLKSTESKLYDAEAIVKDLEKKASTLEYQKKESDAQLKRWASREPEIRHYLGVFAQLADENSTLKRQLAGLGYETPKTNYTMQYMDIVSSDDKFFTSRARSAMRELVNRPKDILTSHCAIEEASDTFRHVDSPAFVSPKNILPIQPPAKRQKKVYKMNEEISSRNHSQQTYMASQDHGDSPLSPTHLRCKYEQQIPSTCDIQYKSNSLSSNSRNLPPKAIGVFPKAARPDLSRYRCESSGIQFRDHLSRKDPLFERQEHDNPYVLDKYSQKSLCTGTGVEAPPAWRSSKIMNEQTYIPPYSSRSPVMSRDSNKTIGKPRTPFQTRSAARSVRPTAASPFFRGDKLEQYRTHSSKLKSPPSYLIEPSVTYGTGVAGNPLYEPVGVMRTSLNGLSFITEPRRSSNKPIYTPTRSSAIAHQAYFGRTKQHSPNTYDPTRRFSRSPPVMAPYFRERLPPEPNIRLFERRPHGMDIYHFPSTSRHTAPDTSLKMIKGARTGFASPVTPFTRPGNRGIAKNKTMLRQLFPRNSVTHPSRR